MASCRSAHLSTATGYIAAVENVPVSRYQVAGLTGSERSMNPFAMIAEPPLSPFCHVLATAFPFLYLALAMIALAQPCPVQMDFHDVGSRGVDRDPDSLPSVVSSLAWHSGRTPFDGSVPYGGAAANSALVVVRQAGLVHSSEVSPTHPNER